MRSDLLQLIVYQNIFTICLQPLEGTTCIFSGITDWPHHTVLKFGRTKYLNLQNTIYPREWVAMYSNSGKHLVYGKYIISKHEYKYIKQYKRMAFLISNPLQLPIHANPAIPIQYSIGISAGLQKHVRQHYPCITLTKCVLRHPGHNDEMEC